MPDPKNEMQLHQWPWARPRPQAGPPEFPLALRQAGGPAPVIGLGGLANSTGLVGSLGGPLGVLGTGVSLAFLLSQLLPYVAMTRKEREEMKLAKQQLSNKALADAMLITDEANRETERQVAAEKAQLRDLSFAEQRAGEAQTQSNLGLIAALLGSGSAQLGGQMAMQSAGIPEAVPDLTRLAEMAMANSNDTYAYLGLR